MPSDARFSQAVYQNSCDSEESRAYAGVRQGAGGTMKLKVSLEKVAIVALATLKILPLGIPFHPYLP